MPDIAGQLTQLWVETLAWFQSHTVQILIGIAAGAIIAIVLRFARGLGERLCRRDKSGAGWLTIFGRAIAKTGNLFIIAVAAKLVVGFAQAPQPVATTVNFVFVFAAVFQAAIWAREIILGMIEHRTAAGDHEALGSAMGIIRLLVTFALFAIALIVVLDNLGVNVTGLIAGLGVGGIAIGLAAQGIFADLFAALAIIFDRPFRRGDVVAYDTTNGTIEAIGLKSTRVRGVNGEQRIISNKNLLDKEITNNTRRERRRTKFALGVAYETPVETLKQLPAMLKEVVESQQMVFVRAGFVNFAASTLDFELEFDSPHQDYQHSYDGRHNVGLAILDRFNREGINLPFPIETSYTAAPDGRLIMPYPEEDGADWVRDRGR